MAEAEFEEKETHLYLDFQGEIDPAVLERPHIFFRLVDMDQERPLVQLGHQLFAGKHNLR